MIYTYINNNSIKKNMITIIILHPIFGSTRDDSVNKKNQPFLAISDKWKKIKKNTRTHPHCLPQNNSLKNYRYC
jgi:hypothetical protein